jgi:hypothetical protein
MQVIEESVGYDIALIPGHVAVWTELGIGRALPGVSTTASIGATWLLAEVTVRNELAEVTHVKSPLQLSEKPSPSRQTA